jgi:polyisoprenoid-binding protein YceI
MKTLKFSLAAMALFAAFTFSSCNQEAPVVEEVEVIEGLSGNYSVNAEASKLSWLGKKVTGEHTGSIAIQEGMFSVSNGLLTSGDVLVNMASLSVEDIEDAEQNAKLSGHLNSEDFFDVVGFPTATLLITEATETTATGELTIKNITNPVTFEYTIAEGETEVTLTGLVIVDRTLYDIKYGSGKFFDDLGDKTIYDEVELTFEVVALK